MTGTIPRSAPRRADPRLAARAESFLLFHLPDALCGLPLSAIRQIVPMALLARPPGMPSLLEGFLDLAGTAVPVVRLDRLFRLPELVLGLYTPVVILNASEDRIALVVESVRGIVAVPPGDVRSGFDGGSFNDCVEGEATVGGLAVHLLSPARLLLEKERQCLAELQAVEQDRLRELEGVRS
jgi:purine-binding chemotaxis protein CheW